MEPAASPSTYRVTIDRLHVVVVMETQAESLPVASSPPPGTPTTAILHMDATSSYGAIYRVCLLTTDDDGGDDDDGDVDDDDDEDDAQGDFRHINITYKLSTFHFHMYVRTRVRVPDFSSPILSETQQWGSGFMLSRK